MKRKIVAGNWKMNLGPSQALELISTLIPSCTNLSSTEVWVCPPHVSIPAVVNASKDSKIEVGAQNVHWENSGAFTGELSVPMLKECGCQFALVGHSERRHIFGESNELVTKRSLGGLEAGFNIVLCIGEKLEERESGATNKVLEQQLSLVLKDLKSEHIDQLIIAYEPVWAIGTGKVAGLSEIEDTHNSIEALWKTSQSAPCPPILYGGSVSPDNFADIIKIPLVAGGLVGGASLVPEKFQALIKIAEEAV